MADQRGSGVLDLVAVMDRLRSPGGCPWDARQTHASLVEYLIEEAYETVEAIEDADRAGLKEELGDLLLQVVFHARIAQEDEDDPWNIDDVAAGIVAKLVSRHPHVFADVDAASAEQVEANWHALKAQEKGRESVTDGIPTALPALVRAGKVLSRSKSLELPEVEAADLVAGLGIRTPEELGETLLALVALGRSHGWDSETELRGAVSRRIAVVREAEGLTPESSDPR